MTTPTPTNLFAAILPLFTGQTERAATETLRHILQNSTPARSALESVLRSDGVAIAPGALTRFQTEVGGDDGERVDLVCSDDKGTELALIEAKFWAALTDNQPNAYLARLPAETSSALLFVAPAQRLETLWPELCRRAQEQHELTATAESGDLRSAIVDGSPRKMLITSWRALLEHMEVSAGNAGDTATTADIRQLLGLTQRMDSDAFLPIHSDELGQQFPRRMVNLVNLVDDATNRAFANGWANAAGLRITPQWHGYGRYIRLGSVVVWFGINIHLWARHGHSPLWLQPQENDRLWELIILPTGAEYDEVLDLVVHQLDLIRQHLNPEQTTDE